MCVCVAKNCDDAAFGAYGRHTEPKSPGWPCELPASQQMHTAGVRGNGGWFCSELGAISGDDVLNRRGQWSVERGRCTVNGTRSAPLLAVLQLPMDNSAVERGRGGVQSTETYKGGYRKMWKRDINDEPESTFETKFARNLACCG